MSFNVCPVLYFLNFCLKKYNTRKQHFGGISSENVKNILNFHYLGDGLLSSKVVQVQSGLSIDVSLAFKGQLISKGLVIFFNSSKKRTKN